jgi:hypothetical protein
VRSRLTRAFPAITHASFTGPIQLVGGAPTSAPYGRNRSHVFVFGTVLALLGDDPNTNGALLPRLLAEQDKSTIYVDCRFAS